MQLLAKDGVSDIDVGHANDTIEGTGVFGGGGFLSFRVSFRCIRGGKRISSAEVDDFRRGVMVGRADKGPADHHRQVHAGGGAQGGQRPRA